MKDVFNSNELAIILGFAILSLTVGISWNKQVQAEKCTSLASAIATTRNGNLLMMMEGDEGRPEDNFFAGVLSILEGVNGVTIEECGLKNE